METRRVLKLFLASPSDTNAERKIVHQVVESWNRSTGARRGWQVDVFDYTKNVAPSYGRDGQTIVFETSGSLRTYTFFVGILKHRFGSPTPRAASGTIEEFRRAVKAYKSTGRIEIMLYFSDGKMRETDNNSLEHKKKVNDFRTSVQGDSFYKTFQSQQDFREQFTEHFAAKMEDQIRKHSRASHRTPATRQTAKPSAPKQASRPTTTTPPKPTAASRNHASTAGAPRARAAKEPASKATTRSTAATVSSSGLRILLDNRIFRCRPVKGNGSQLTMELLTRGGEEENVLRRLSSTHHYGSLAYAHNRDAGQVRVDSCEHQSDGRDMVWTLKATIQRPSSGGWMAPEETEKRIRLLLLGSALDPSPSDPSLGGVMSITNRRSTHQPGLFAPLWQTLSGNRSEFLYAAFLHAIYNLKKDGLCDDVIELKLGPIKGSTLHVHFKGRITPVYSGSTRTIEVKGDCELTEP